MTTSQKLMEAAKLRLRLQMNAQMRLEVLAAIARVFREYRDPLTDELLSTLILAVPEELLGEAQLSSTPGHRALNPPTPAFKPKTPVSPKPSAPRQTTNHSKRSGETLSRSSRATH